MNDRVLPIAPLPAVDAASRTQAYPPPFQRGDTFDLGIIEPTQAEVQAFSKEWGDSNPFHFDGTAALECGLGSDPIAHGMLIVKSAYKRMASGILAGKRIAIKQFWVEFHQPLPIGGRARHRLVIESVSPPRGKIWTIAGLRIDVVRPDRGDELCAAALIRLIVYKSSA